MRHLHYIVLYEKCLVAYRRLNGPNLKCSKKKKSKVNPRNEVDVRLSNLNTARAAVQERVLFIVWPVGVTHRRKLAATEDSCDYF